MPLSLFLIITKFGADIFEINELRVKQNTLMAFDDQSAGKQLVNKVIKNLKGRKGDKEVSQGKVGFTEDKLFRLRIQKTILTALG